MTAEKVCLLHLRFCGKNGRGGVVVVVVGIQPLPVPPSSWGPGATSSVTPGCYLGTGQGDKIRVVWRHQDGVCTPFEPAEIPRRVGLVVHLLFNGVFVVLGFFFLRGSIGISHAVLLAMPPRRWPFGPRWLLRAAGLGRPRLLLPSEFAGRVFLPSGRCAVEVAAIWSPWHYFACRRRFAVEFCLGSYCMFLKLLSRRAVSFFAFWPRAVAASSESFSCQDWLL